MLAHHFELFDPLLSEREASAMLELAERFGSYGMYSEEWVDSEIGRGLAQRYDAASNFVRSGGRFGRREPVAKLAARTNYFRETYAYGDEIRAPGIEPFLHHAGFVEAARRIHGRPLIVPAIVYANLLVPGQELAVHTDVPEFRGCNRKRHPQWLLVAMHHSGLFDAWRMPIATGVAWFGSCEGGQFAFYPEGAQGAPRALPARHDTAILLDTDSVFHGVDRVSERRSPLAPLRPGQRLHAEGGGRWSLRDGDRVLARYAPDEVRFSISWKAYCFRDEAERSAWETHSEDLDVERVVGRLVDDLRERGRIGAQRPADADLALLIIDEYIHFPPPAVTQ